MQMSFYTKNQADFSAEVVLGKLGYVGCWDAEMRGTKPEFWTSTKTLKQINSDTVQQSNCTLLCDWLTVAALVLQCNKWDGCCIPSCQNCVWLEWIKFMNWHHCSWWVAKSCLHLHELHAHLGLCRELKMAKAKYVLVWLSSQEKCLHADIQVSPNTVLSSNRINLSVWCCLCKAGKSQLYRLIWLFSAGCSLLQAEKLS